MDLEMAYDHNLKQQETILLRLIDDFFSNRVPLTIFSTYNAMDAFPSQLSEFINNGNEIGCHGLYHSQEENYRKMPEEIISQNILCYNNKYFQLFGKTPSCFRGPFMSTSSASHRVLIDNGCEADFSVCSQRFDFLISRGGDIRWLTAPRKPYMPDSDSPFKKGNEPLWIIPLSCAVLPFTSGILYLFGLNFMKAFYRFLLRESLKTAKPIIYMFHSYEFAEFTGYSKSPNGENIVKKNLPVHQRFYVKDKSKRYEMNSELIRYMLSFDSVKPLTGTKYIKILSSN
jgi:hypothetical protein